MSYLNGTTLSKDIKAVKCVSGDISAEYQEARRHTGFDSGPVDLIDHICCAEQDDIIDALHSILSLHPEAFYQFIATQHLEIKLTTVESLQAS
ncbi:hypothetical protein [Psychromonas antarctica]|uniref:hypothetical protein n=1 Tax=Psychromonas antarctica TaxID=67573 RepID=UPI001EE95A14|nr:hypothetical protein [Psychromonas antarctica]MCG6202333.1 hypothetical protein [Psychromonas antarctica]